MAHPLFLIGGRLPAFSGTPFYSEPSAFGG
jgi:hypothetical protein